MITLPTYLITFPDNEIHLSAASPTNLARQILARIRHPDNRVIDVLIPLDDDMNTGDTGWIEAPNGVRLGKFGIKRVGA